MRGEAGKILCMNVCQTVCSQAESHERRFDSLESRGKFPVCMLRVEVDRFSKTAADDAREPSRKTVDLLRCGCILKRGFSLTQVEETSEKSKE